MEGVRGEQHTHVSLYALDLEVANDERVRERLAFECEVQLLPHDTCARYVSRTSPTADALLTSAPVGADQPAAPDNLGDLLAINGFRDVCLHMAGLLLDPGEGHPQFNLAAGASQVVAQNTLLAGLCQQHHIVLMESRSGQGVTQNIWAIATHVRPGVCWDRVRIDVKRYERFGATRELVYAHGIHARGLRADVVQNTQQIVHLL